MIGTILQKWIQLKKTPEDAALFDFTVLSSEVALLSTDIGTQTTLDEFLDRALQHFAQVKLEINLQNIREKLQSDAKPRAQELLLALQAASANCGYGIDTSALRAAIGRATTQLQITFDRIVEWFRYRGPEAREPFSVEEAVHTSELAIKGSAPDFRAELSIAKEMENFRIQGKLRSFVDIFYQVFQNIAKHSGIQPAVAHVEAALEDSTLILRVKNEVRAGVATEGVRNSVRTIADAVQQRPLPASVTKEGGTGLLKVHKILQHDFAKRTGGREPALRFGFEGDTAFCVEVRIPILDVEGEGGKDA